MKGIFTSLPVALALIILFTTASRAVEVAVEPRSQTVQEGSQAIVDVVISGLGDGVAPSLGVFDLDITYNTSILSFSSYILGPYLGDPSLEQAIISSKFTSGTVNLYELSLLEESEENGSFLIGPYLEEIQSDSFTLATLTFDALAIGTSSLDISINSLGDAAGNPFDPAPTVESSSVSIVPAPVTIILMGSGLGLLGFVRNKRLFRNK